jgi:uncharacterized protein (UPF0276 family)
MRLRASSWRAAESTTSSTSRRTAKLSSTLSTMSLSIREFSRSKALHSPSEKSTISFLEISKSVILISENWIPTFGKTEDHLTQLQFSIPRIRMMASPFSLGLSTPRKERPIDQLPKLIRRIKTSTKSHSTK